MSVTVSDLLKLPSLREAKVIGGRNGLNKIVSSISVLESTRPEILVEGIFPENEFFGSEIVITGFLNMTEDVELQCANIRKLAEGGEIGLILFYVGVYLKRVDRRLIELADKLDFVLISMPENRANLRYGEVLNDVSECIFMDRMQEESFVSDILGRVSRLPAHQRSVNTVLKMVSDRISASVILWDAGGNLLNLVAWPRAIEPVIKAQMMEYGGGEITRQEPAAASSAMLSAAPETVLPGATCYSFPLDIERGDSYVLRLIKEGKPLSDTILEQVVDVVRLGLNIWGEMHAKVAIHELVQAIMQDEPMKMRRLADIFHVDVASIHEMWILQKDGFTQKQTADSLKQLKQNMKYYVEPILMDGYENKILFFMTAPESVAEAERIAAYIMECMPEGIVTRCNGLHNTKDVRQAYMSCCNYLADARVIFPGKAFYQLSEIQFAGECRQLIAAGEDSVTDMLSVLDRLEQDRGNPDREHEELLSMLAFYYFEGNASVTRTAELLYLHKNTVKYRLRRITELLGCKPDRMPEKLKLYQALAVRRLLEQG